MAHLLAVCRLVHWPPLPFQFRPIPWRMVAVPASPFLPPTPIIATSLWTETGIGKLLAISLPAPILLVL